MYPTIHDFTANNLNTQGYGALSDCISCDVTEELNGGFTLELQYPLNGIHVEYLQTGNIIMVKPNHKQGKQPFRISQIRKSFANNITVYANHISYDLSGYVIRDSYSYNSLAEVIAAMNTVDWSSQSDFYNDFEFSTDMTSNKGFSMPYLQTLRSWMGGQEGSILDVYGGEWEYDTFNCFLKERRGNDTGIRISYGKNLAEYEKQRDYVAYSHVVAYWSKSGAVVYSDLVPTGISCAFRCAYIDAGNVFENQPSTAQLNTYAESQIAGMDFGAQTITVTPAQIGNDVIGLGDGVLVCYENVFSTRVIKTVWDALAGRYKLLQLGSKKANIADTIKTLTNDKNGSMIKSLNVSGTPNSYGCLNTGLAKDVIVLSAKTPTDGYDDSAMITPFVAGGTWWFRATKWQDGWTAITSAVNVTVFYV